MSSLIGIHTDTALWLHNKLRNDESPWASGNIASQFTNNILNDIYDCFMQLESKAKIKILLSLLEIPLRNMEGLKDSICRIVAIAEEDMDEWVRVAANIVRDYPEQFVFDQRLGKVTTHFQETVHEVVSEIERIQNPVNANLIPGECLYLNRTALSKIISTPPNPAKHFTLRRKPKSAELRAKITQKASEAANQRRSMHSSGMGSKSSLKRTHSVPSGGKLPPVQHSKSGMSKTRPRKTQILEFADQPIGLREQKKRKKMQASEGTPAEETTKTKGKKPSSSSATISSDKQDEEEGTEEKDSKQNIKVETSGGEQESEANTPQAQEPDEAEDQQEDEDSPHHKREDEPEDTHNLSHDDEDDDESKPTTPTTPYSPTIDHPSLASQMNTDLVSPTIPPPVAADGQLLYNLHTNNNKQQTNIDGQRRRKSSSSSSTSNLLTSPPPPVAQQHNQQYNMSQQQQQQQNPQQAQQQPQQKLSHEVNLNASLSTSTFQQELQMRVQHEKEMRLKHEQKQQQQQQKMQQQAVQQQSHHSQQQNNPLQHHQQQSLQHHQLQQNEPHHSQQHIPPSQQQSLHDQHSFQDYQRQQHQIQQQQQSQQHHAQQQQLYNQHFLQQQQQLRQHQQHLQQRQYNANSMQQQHMGTHPQQQAQGMPLSHQQMPMGGTASNVPGMQPNQSNSMNSNQQKKGLSLTREQMLAAQEMFRSANTVTRAEKALILGFMAGARENPFPQQGAVITIKLSEEMIAQGEQQVLVEMLFEMNYDTGHWRRLKRTRVIQQNN